MNEKQELRKFKPFRGPLRPVFKDPDTGYDFAAPSQAALYQHIKSYREQNSLPPIEMLQFVVENFQCHLPENAGSWELNDVLHRGFVDVLSAAGVLLVKSLLFKEMATQEEAERRASICAGDGNTPACPRNIFHDRAKGSLFRKWCDDMAKWMAGGRKSSKHEDLGQCSACTCPLGAKVFQANPSPSAAHLSQMPDFCWQRKKE